MPAQAPDLSLTEWMVLTLLCEGKSHGFAIARTLGKSTALGEVWTVPRPLVYRALGRLEDQGLIAGVGEEPGDPGPPRAIYKATAAGKRAASQWRAEPVAHLREVRTTFLAKVLLRQRLGEPVAPLVSAQREVFGPILGRIEEQFGSGPGAVSAWRYESSQAVARLLDHLEREAVSA